MLVLKTDERLSPYQVVPFAIFTNIGFNLSVKVCARENPYKNCEFWLIFSVKNPVKSDKLALIIEGKILNLMFLAIYIPVVPFENWLRITQRDKKIIIIKKKTLRVRGHFILSRLVVLSLTLV